MNYDFNNLENQYKTYKVKQLDHINKIDNIKELKKSAITQIELDSEILQNNFKNGLKQDFETRQKLDKEIKIRRERNKIKNKGQKQRMFDNSHNIWINANNDLKYSLLNNKYNKKERKYQRYLYDQNIEIKDLKKKLELEKSEKKEKEIWKDKKANIVNEFGAKAAKNMKKQFNSMDKTIKDNERTVKELKSSLDNYLVEKDIWGKVQRTRHEIKQKEIEMKMKFIEAKKRRAEELKVMKNSEIARKRKVIQLKMEREQNEINELTLSLKEVTIGSFIKPKLQDKTTTERIKMLKNLVRSRRKHFVQEQLRKKLVTKFQAEKILMNERAIKKREELIIIKNEEFKKNQAIRKKQWEEKQKLIDLLKNKKQRLQEQKDKEEQLQTRLEQLKASLENKYSGPLKLKKFKDRASEIKELERLTAIQKDTIANERQKAIDEFKNARELIKKQNIELQKTTLAMKTQASSIRNLNSGIKHREEQRRKEIETQRLNKLNSETRVAREKALMLIERAKLMTNLKSEAKEMLAEAKMKAKNASEAKEAIIKAQHKRKIDLLNDKLSISKEQELKKMAKLEKLRLESNIRKNFLQKIKLQQIVSQKETEEARKAYIKALAEKDEKARLALKEQAFKTLREKEELSRIHRVNEKLRFEQYQETLRKQKEASRAYLSAKLYKQLRESKLKSQEQADIERRKRTNSLAIEKAKMKQLLKEQNEKLAKTIANAKENARKAKETAKERLALVLAGQKLKQQAYLAKFEEKYAKNEKKILLRLKKEDIARKAKLEVLEQKLEKAQIRELEQKNATKLAIIAAKKTILLKIKIKAKAQAKLIARRVTRENNILHNRQQSRLNTVIHMKQRLDLNKRNEERKKGLAIRYKGIALKLRKDYVRLRKEKGVAATELYLAERRRKMLEAQSRLEQNDEEKKIRLEKKRLRAISIAINAKKKLDNKQKIEREAKKQMKFARQTAAKIIYDKKKEESRTKLLSVKLNKIKISNERALKRDLRIKKERELLRKIAIEKEENFQNKRLNLRKQLKSSAQDLYNLRQIEKIKQKALDLQKKKDFKQKKISDKKNILQQARLEKIKMQNGIRFIKIKLKRKKKLYLAEVQVFSNDVNIALNKPAKQSSIKSGGVASKAVNGSIDGGKRSVIQTRNRNAWWEVDLQGYFNIDKIVIYNRTDRYWTKLKKATIYLMNKDRKIMFKQNLKGQKNPQTIIPKVKSKTLAKILNAGNIISNNNIIALKGGRNHFFCRNDKRRNRIICKYNTMNKTEHFVITFSNNPNIQGDIKSGDTISLQGLNGDFCTDNNKMSCIKNNKSKKEKFTILKINGKFGDKIVSGDKIVLRGGKNNKYCIEDNKNNIMCNASSINTFGMFQIIMVEKKSKLKHVTQLSYDQMKALKKRESKKKKILYQAVTKSKYKLYLYAIYKKKLVRQKTHLNKSKWKRVKHSACCIRDIAFHNDKRLYAVGTDGSLMRKDTDAIDSKWTNVDNSLRMTKIAINNKNEIFGLKDGKIYKRTTDSGSIWNLVDNTVTAISISFNANILYYIASNRTIFKKETEDINSKWILVSSRKTMIDLAFKNGIMYGTDGKKIYGKRSILDTSRWKRLRRSFPTQGITVGWYGQVKL